MEEMPVIPLFYGSYNFLKSEKITGVYFSDLGYLDFKNASVE
jgi:oligopeptide transport system substrate-binding protein